MLAIRRACKIRRIGSRQGRQDRQVTKRNSAAVRLLAPAFDLTNWWSLVAHLDTFSTSHRINTRCLHIYGDHTTVFHCITAMNMRLTLGLQIHGLSFEDVKKTWCSSNSEKVLKPSNAPQGLKHMSIQQLSVIHKQIHLDHFLIVIWLCKSFMPNFCIATRLIVLSCGIEPSTAACHKTTAEDKCMTGAAKRNDPRNGILLGHHNYLQKHVCCKKVS